MTKSPVDPLTGILFSPPPRAISVADMHVRQERFGRLEEKLLDRAEEIFERAVKVLREQLRATLGGSTEF